jgi:FkbM family methyltransferase
MFKEELRYQYDLNASSIVFDIGGYKGEFSKNIFDKFGCKVYCFEPVFQIKNKDIKIYDYALGAATDVLTINVDIDKTGKFCKTGYKHEIVVIDIVTFLKNNHIQNIDLMKINIEGMEYELLRRLIDSDYIRIIDNIQVQFHNINPESDRLMYEIQRDLKKTHSPTWQFRYVWENWKRNG